MNTSARSSSDGAVTLDGVSPTGSEVRAGIGKWMAYYNAERPRSSHGILTPGEAYEENKTNKNGSLNEILIHPNRAENWSKK